MRITFFIRGGIFISESGGDVAVVSYVMNFESDVFYVCFLRNVVGLSMI